MSPVSSHANFILTAHFSFSIYYVLSGLLFEPWTGYFCWQHFCLFSVLPFKQPDCYCCISFHLSYTSLQLISNNNNWSSNFAASLLHFYVLFFYKFWISVKPCNRDLQVQIRTSCSISFPWSTFSVLHVCVVAICSVFHFHVFYDVLNYFILG